MKNLIQINSKLLCTIGTFFMCSICLSQIPDINQLKAQHDETPQDAYTEVDKSLMERSPAYREFRSSDFFTVQVNIDANGNNIVGDAGNEPSIAVDPTNPDRIVIGWRQFDTVSNNFRQAGYAYSLDGGLTWTFPGVINPGVFRSDPVLDFDAEGNFYYNSLQGTFECDVYKITDGGVVWDGPEPAFGGDKQWMRMDRTNGIGAANNYSNWNSNFTTCAPGYFTRSTDGSNTFESCIEIDNDPFWGTLAVDKNGVLYISGMTSSGMQVIKSLNAQDPAATIAWEVASTVDLDGFLRTGSPLNPQGLWGQAWVDVDISDGPGEGNVYYLATVDRQSVSDPADVMFARSTDGGATFEAPIKINDDASTSNYQWFGTMSVAPNGRIDVVWLDTRDAPTGTVDSVLYYSYSIDEGDTWSDNEAISPSFDPTIGYPQQSKMGDYFDMKSDNDGAHLAWANTINGGQDVYYSHIIPDVNLGVDDLTSAAVRVANYPNPFSEETTIEFYLSETRNVTVDVFDISGRKVNTLLDESRSGLQKLRWDGSGAGGELLGAGLYFVTVQVEGAKAKVMKVVKE